MSHKGRETSQEKRGFRNESGSSTKDDRSGAVRDDLPDIAKIGSDLLKRTVVTGIGVLKDVTDGLPKEASNLLARSKEEMMKNLLSKEVLQVLSSSMIDKLFAKIREHKLEVSVRIKEADDSNPVPKQKQAETSTKSRE